MMRTCAGRDLYVYAKSIFEIPGLNPAHILGSITSNITGFKASDVAISYSGAQCNRTSTGFDCQVQYGAEHPYLTVSNYCKSGVTRVACIDLLERYYSTEDRARFYLPTGPLTGANIIIKEGRC